MLNEEIYSQLFTHAHKGLDLHNQLANAFGYLNLIGYQKSQIYHFLEETYNYRKLQDFYLRHYNKIIEENNYENPHIIPNNWYKYARMAVDANTRRAAIKDLFDKWINWEMETCAFLTSLYKELYEQNDMHGAFIIQEYILEVGHELEQAREQQINLEAINYDLSQIVAEQEHLYQLYQNKIKHLYEEDDIK